MFVLQIEGNSSWKISAETTQKGSNANVSDDNEKVDKTLRITLRQGDCIYIPKHYEFGESFSPGKFCDVHSLYVIIYTNEFDSYPKMLEMILPHAVEEMVTSYQPSADSKEMPRRFLSRKSFSYLGVAHSEQDEEEDCDEQGVINSTDASNHKNILCNRRSDFFNRLKIHLEEITKTATALSDAAVDQVCI